MYNVVSTHAKDGSRIQTCTGPVEGKLQVTAKRGGSKNKERGQDTKGGDHGTAKGWK